MNYDLATSTDYANFFSNYHWCWKLKINCEAINKAIVRTTRVVQCKSFVVWQSSFFDFCWTAELWMFTRKQKKCAFRASFSESVKFFNENSFTQETDFFSEWGKLLVCDWSTREYLKLRPMSSSILFTKQTNADVSICFKWRKWGANKIYWWAISGKCLQDKYQKYNFISEDCKAKCAKT